MNLKDRINEDMKAAMRARDSERLGTIRMLTAAIKQREVDERVTLDDAGVVAVVDRLIKQRRDSAAAFQQAGREDLVQRETAEIAVLQAYLPARLSADEIAAAVQALVGEMATELGRAPAAGDMGRLMAAAKAKFAGRADMAQVSAAVRTALGG